jgi:ankyrin repeat protein
VRAEALGEEGLCRHLRNLFLSKSILRISFGRIAMDLVETHKNNKQSNKHSSSSTMLSFRQAILCGLVVVLTLPTEITAKSSKTDAQTKKEFIELLNFARDESKLPKNKADLVKRLREGYNPNTEFKAGVPMLHFGAMKGDVNMVELLLGAGADIEIKGTNGMTALHGAAMNGKSDIVKLLLEQGAGTENVLDGKYREETPLFLAVMGSHVESARALLDGGANANAKNSDGMSLLHTSAFQGNRPITKLLLKNGADGGVVARGKTPYQLAQMKGHKKVTDAIKRFEQDRLKRQSEAY